MGLLLAGLACRLTGSHYHEWIGLAFLSLIVVHLVQHWCWKWLTGFNAPLLAVTLLFLASAILVSQEVFATIGLAGLAGGRQAHKWHRCLAYWVFILSSVHIGWHWDKVAGGARPNQALRALAAIFSVYGLAAFWRKEIGLKLIGYYTFDFWDYDQPVPLFFLDYLAIMACCLVITRYTRKLVGNGR